MTKLAFLLLTVMISLSYLSCGSCGSDTKEESETVKKAINLTINGVVGFDTLSTSIPEEDASKIPTLTLNPQTTSEIR